MAAINFDARVYDTRYAIANSVRLTDVQKSALFVRLEDALYAHDHARNPYSRRAERSKVIRLCARLIERAEDGYVRF